MMIKWTIIKSEVFHFNVNVFIVTDRNKNKLDDTIKKCWIEESIYSDTWKFDWFTYYKEETDEMFLFIYKNNIKTISHEVVHIVMRLLHSRWIPIRIENDEVFAYLVWYYCKEISKLF